jgi:hypothetical protein
MVGKINHAVNNKLHDFQRKASFKQEVSWQSKACCKQEVTQLAKQNML